MVRFRDHPGIVVIVVIVVVNCYQTSCDDLVHLVYRQTRQPDSYRDINQTK